MRNDQDVAAFAARAPRYDVGRLGKLHHEIAERALALALTECPSPERLLDVGCGTGYLLRLASQRLPEAVELAGVDPAAAMIAVAETARTDDRISLLGGVGAEHLPFADETFDLVMATTSFDHWSDQRAGLAECARVLRSDGLLVLADQISPLLTPTLLLGRRGRARTRRRVARLLEVAGFGAPRWRPLYRPVIAAALARR